MNFWIGEILKAAEIITPILFGVWLMYRKERKEVTKRHEQNVQLLTDIAKDRLYFPPHNHSEQNGDILTEKGISYSPMNGR